MSSKRALYKPTESSKDKRKTLAQGRLVTKPTGQAHPVRPTASRTLAQGIGTDEKPGEVSVTVALGQSARQNLSSLLKSEVSFQGEQSINPRRITPHISQIESPRKNDPSNSLDLSDNDSEVIFKNRHGSTDAQPEVLVVDALRHRRGPDDSEIDIQMGFKPSPAKVICHTTASDLRNTGDVSLAQRVHVDQIPTVNMSIESDTLGKREEGVGCYDDTPPLGTTPHSYRSPLVIRESSANDVSFENNPSTSNPIVKKLFPKSADDMSPKLEDLGPSRLQKSISEVSIDSAEYSLSDASEISERGTTKPSKKLGPPKTKSAALSTSDIKKKKKATRVVQSRFMQSSSAVVKKGPMKATDRSIMTKSAANLPSHHLGVPAGPSSRKGSTPSKKKKATTPSNRTQSFSTTPEVKGQGGKVSTPTCDGSLFMAPGGVDLSVIVPQPSTGIKFQEQTDQSYNGSVSHPHGNLSATRQKGTSNSRGFRDADAILKAEKAENEAMENTHKKKVPPRMTQKKLDIQYCRYIQWVFLESKARKAFQEQEKQVMSQLYALSQENEKLRRRDHELDLELARLRHLHMLDDTLETQASGLTSIASSIPNLRKQYSTMAQALDTTRHQMPAKGIVVPADQEDYARELLRALAESEQLLGEIQTLTRPESQTTSSFVDTIQIMEKSLETELQEMSKVKELLAAAHTLSTQESSLQIQTMQANEQ